jgi:hypothetical protein
MDFFRKKKGDGKNKKQGKKDKNENKKSSPKGDSPAVGLDVKVTNESRHKENKSYKETNIDGNSRELRNAQTVVPPAGYAESPSLEVQALAKTPEPDNEVVIVNNCDLSPNGVQAYEQFNEVLHKMDRALETEESEDDMDASSLGLALRTEPDIDMSPFAYVGLQNSSQGTFQLAGVTTDDQDVDDQVAHARTVPLIHVTQPSVDSAEQMFDVEATALNSPLEWNTEDVVNWCNSKGLTYFAELFEGKTMPYT